MQLRAALAAATLSAITPACTRDLSLPGASGAPVIASFEPTAAFSGDPVVVYGTNFDAYGNQLTFPGGATALADRTPDGGDVLVDGGLVFRVPASLSGSGPLVLVNTRGRSDVSASDFLALGPGHPTLGTPVAQLRFRHNPVGLVDTPDNVLMASSIFDLVVTDSKVFKTVPGRPMALTPSPNPNRGLLSLSTPTGGLFLEVSAADGEVFVESAESDVREVSILPAADAQTLARTVGVDAHGRSWLSEWSVQDGGLVPTRAELQLTDVIGAAALGSLVVVAGRGAQETTASLYVATATTTTKLWSPSTDPAMCGVVITAECAPPDGPIAIVPAAASDGGSPPGPSIVASVASGDLLIIDSDAPNAFRTVVLSSYAPVAALAAGAADDKLLLTKALDGAVFQYDLTSDQLDWSVQLRGQPTVVGVLLDVADDYYEVAVGNQSDNAVDLVDVSSGTWVGRIAFDLGLGSSDATLGGIVAPYSNDPARYPPGTEIVQRMDVLMRNVGLVVSVDANSLDVLDHVVLDPTAGPPQRLAVTADLNTLVIHPHKLGLLETTPSGRSERIVSESDVTQPFDVAVLATGDIVLSSIAGVTLYRWEGAPDARMLGSVGELPVPAGATLRATAVDGDEVLMVWSTAAGYGGAFYPVDMLMAGGVPETTLGLDPQLSELLGAPQLREGPALLFARNASGSPVSFTAAQLRTQANPVDSVVSGPRLSGVSPDGHFVVWLDEGGVEPIVRLVSAFQGQALVGYSSYRLSAPPAGPAFDPSGQSLYIPVPLLDEVDVVQ